MTREGQPNLQEYGLKATKDNLSLRKVSINQADQLLCDNLILSSPLQYLCFATPGISSIVKRSAAPKVSQEEGGQFFCQIPHSHATEKKKLPSGGQASSMGTSSRVKIQRTSAVIILQRS